VKGKNYKIKLEGAVAPFSARGDNDETILPDGMSDEQKNH
jgi:hypothetical protein